MLERIPIHCLLVASFFVLTLWASNAREVPAGDVLAVLGLVVGATIGFAVVASLTFRSLRRGALTTTTAVVVVLSYGHVAAEVPADVGVAVTSILLAVAVVAIHAAGERTVAIATSIVNVMALALVATVVPGVIRGLQTSGVNPVSEVEKPDGGLRARSGESRDIFYVVFDRYPRGDTLRERFGHDNTAFEQMLEDFGFQLADESLANYPKTAHSLAASLNMTYLDEVASSIPKGNRDDLRPLHRMVGEHRVGAWLTGAGYEYVHVGSWWGPTSTSSTADRVLTFRSGTEFSRLFRSTTIWPAIVDALGVGSPVGNRELIRAFTEHQLQTLEELAVEEAERPRFVFAHVTLPHPPAVFDMDGSYVPERLERRRTRGDNLVRQVQYVNRWTEDFLSLLFEESPPGREPIVLLQSDEGPDPVSRLGRDPLPWLEVTDHDLAEKLRILSAYHVPGLEIPAGTTPVNSFRLVLRHYFHVALPPLPDRSFVFPSDSDVYTFIDVTERVRG